MRLVGMALFAAAFSMSAEAQLRAAVSPDLTPEAAEAAFMETVDACIAAVTSGRRLADGAAPGLVATTDTELRRQAAATDEDAIFEVRSARGVVAAVDQMTPQGPRCLTSVYGPPAAPLVMGLARRLSSAENGFERLAAAARPTGLGASLFAVRGGRRLQVLIDGSEPGMPGHRSRFSVVTATVFSTPAE